MPVFLTCMLTCLGRDDKLPDTEDFVWEALTFYTMGIPIMRDAAVIAKDALSSTPRVSGRSPLIYAGAMNFFKGLGDTQKAITENDPDAEYKALKELVNAFGFAMGLGTPQTFRTWEGTEAWIDGNGGPLTPLLGKPIRLNKD